jgi:hypothetical protein
MSEIIAHVRYSEEMNDWTVDITRGGLAGSPRMNNSEIIAMVRLWDYLAGVTARCPVDQEWLGRGKNIHLHNQESWYIGSENVA